MGHKMAGIEHNGLGQGLAGFFVPVASQVKGAEFFDFGIHG
jgi:hypothetical protein